MRIIIGLLFLALIVLIPFPVGSQFLGFGPPSCTVAQVIAQTCGNRTAGHRIVIIDGDTSEIMEVKKYVVIPD